jgi:hypothetical protein
MYQFYTPSANENKSPADSRDGQLTMASQVSRPSKSLAA